MHNTLKNYNIKVILPIIDYCITNSNLNFYEIFHTSEVLQFGSEKEFEIFKNKKENQSSKNDHLEYIFTYDKTNHPNIFIHKRRAIDHILKSDETEIYIILLL